MRDDVVEQLLSVLAYIGERLASIAERVAAQGVRPTLVLFIAGGILLRLARWDSRPRVRRRALLSFAGVMACYAVLEAIYEARAMGALVMTLAQIVPLAIAIRWVRQASGDPESGGQTGPC